MIQISEVLPNPIGNDAEGEWIELQNTGSEAVSLLGFKLKTSGKKEFALSGTIGPGEYLLLRRPQTKLTLKNEGDTITILGKDRKILDEVKYSFKVDEGKSLVRIDGRLFLGSPTPGAENREIFTASMIKTNFVPEEVVSRGVAWSEGLGLALFLGLGILFLIKRNENLSNIFFGSNKESRKESSF